MKKIAFALVAALVGLTSCSNEETVGGDATEMPGVNQIVRTTDVSVRPTTLNSPNTISVVVPTGTTYVNVVYPTASGSKTLQVPVKLGEKVANTAFTTATFTLSTDKETVIDVQDQNGNTVLQGKRLCPEQDIEHVVQVTSIPETEPVDVDFFLKNFPESVNNENKESTLEDFAQNFLYKSDGKGFKLYPQYSKGTYVWRLGVFYYDKEGVKHDVQIWDTEGNWKNSDAAFEEICPSETSGINVYIPKGYVFGFYVYSYTRHDADGYGHEYRNHDACRNEYYKGTFYSYKELNTICDKRHADCASDYKYFGWADHWRNHFKIDGWESLWPKDHAICEKMGDADHQKFGKTPRPAKECHAVTYKKDGKTFIGFEDSDYDVWSWYGDGNCGSSDRDFNDLIFWITPNQEVVSGPNDAGEGEDKIEDAIEDSKEDIEKAEEEDDTPEITLPDDIVTPSQDVKDGDYYTHSSGVAFFDTDKDKDFNDAVLDYDIEGYLPGVTSTEAGKWPYIKATIHVRAIADKKVTGAGLDFEDLNKDYICPADDMYITVNGKELAETLTVKDAPVSGENVGTGSAHTVMIKGLQWLTDGSAVATGYNKDINGNPLYNVEVNEVNSGEGLLTITVVMYPKDYKPEDIETWKGRIDDIVCNIAKQKFFVTLEDGTVVYDCVKAPVMTKHSMINEEGYAYTLAEAYPKFQNWVNTNGAEDADWYAYPVEDKVSIWW